MLGPFNNGDANSANTEAIETRRIVPVPHFLAGLWLRGGDGLTPGLLGIDIDTPQLLQLQKTRRLTARPSSSSSTVQLPLLVRQARPQ